MTNKLYKENILYNVAKTTNKIKLKIYEGELYGNIGTLSETAAPVEGAYSPSLDFSDERNSQYVPLI